MPMPSRVLGETRETSQCEFSGTSTARAVILRALRTSEAAIRRLRRARRARRHREVMDYASRLRAHGHG